MRTSSQLGSSLVEVLVAIALAGLLLPVLTEAVLTAQATQPAAERHLEAISLMREEFEALRVIREADWSQLATAGTYHATTSGNSWTLASGSEAINGYTRQVVLANVQRDSSGAIVASGSDDPATVKATVTVSWSSPYAASVSGVTYLTQWLHSSAWEQTTQTDFAAGTLTNTVVTADGDGAVQLSGSSSGTYESATFDAATNVSFNSLGFTTAIPAGATLDLQVATSNTPTPGSWSYAGPDGTSGTYYTSPGAIPLTLSANRYLRFKAFLSTSATTPTLDDVTIGYTQ